MHKLDQVAFLIGRFLCWIPAILLLFHPASLPAAEPASTDAFQWTVFVAHDNCPDYTWGFTESQTRQAFADIVKAHLDEMNRTEALPKELRDHYTMAVTQEALCFVEKYPERKDELVARIHQGRVFVSPFLCNSLWAFQDFEGALRTLYPARRLQRDWGIPIDAAEHIEHPALPWGMATILSGAGVRWLSVPFYNYDSTFNKLTNPPLFIYEGPDGSALRVVMDPWASNKFSYAQGAALLKNPASTREWIAHYSSLGQTYPLKFFFASGTHSDISPTSGGQIPAFARAFEKARSEMAGQIQFLNATLPQFCTAVDQAQNAKPFLPTFRGCFGHSWDLWPVSLARYAADMRNAQRAFLSAETLLAVASLADPSLAQRTQADRRRAEWCWAMLSDHAWNGTDDANKRHNAKLRKEWAATLSQSAQQLGDIASQSLGLSHAKKTWTVFNPLSIPQQPMLCIPVESPNNGVRFNGQGIPVWISGEGGDLYMNFTCPSIPPFGFLTLERTDSFIVPKHSNETQAIDPAMIRSPFYQIRLDQATGNIVSMLHIPTDTHLISEPAVHKPFQSIYFDGREHTLTDVRTEIDKSVAVILARLKISGKLEGMNVVYFITVYQDLDRVDFDLRIDKPVSSKEQRLCQFFPLLSSDAELRIDTPGAVIRPKPQPAGDLLPGADPRRFCVQDFLSISQPGKLTVTIVPVDAFALRLDLGEPAFECLGNDQNYKEVIQDQDGVTSFRFRYSLQAHEGGYDQVKAVAFSRSVLQPPLVLPGRIDPGKLRLPKIVIDPAQAVATCLKPADDPAEQGLILRLRDVDSQGAPLFIDALGFMRAKQTDLLERDQADLEFKDGKLQLPLKANGFASLRLIPR